MGNDPIHMLSVIDNAFRHDLDYQNVLFPIILDLHNTFSTQGRR
jgi:hypothetical protein